MIKMTKPRKNSKKVKMADWPLGSFRDSDSIDIGKIPIVSKEWDDDFEWEDPGEDFKKRLEKGEIHVSYSDNLISQYEFFRKNIYEPKRVFYPSCELDCSPIKGFPNSEVTLIDIDDRDYVDKVMKQDGIIQFVKGDALKHKPKNPYDLVVILNPCLKSKGLTKHLVKGGYALANNWHDNASQLLENKSFEDIGTIDINKEGFYLAEKDFSKLEPNQFATYFYVFKKLGEKI